MRKGLLFIVFSILLITARGQTNYRFRYWFNNDISTITNGNGSDETILDIDVSKLSPYQTHSLHLQVINDNGDWSSVRTLYFMKTATTPRSESGRYWFDHDETSLKTTDITNGKIDLDTKGLITGLHSVHFQTLAEDGTSSSVRTQYFLLTDVENEMLRCQLWIDEDKTHAQMYPVNNEDIIIDISDITEGNHLLNIILFDGADAVVAKETKEFTIVNNTGMYDINIDEKSEKSPYYKLNGEKTDKPRKGIYIKLGRKTIVK